MDRSVSLFFSFIYLSIIRGGNSIKQDEFVDEVKHFYAMGAENIESL